MMFSPVHNYVFIHIPKSAGSSIRKSLSDIDRPPRPLRIWNRLTGRKIAQPVVEIQSLHTHSDARDVLKSLGTETYGKCFTFAFVRNPWDRIVSLYNHVWQGALDRAAGRQQPKVLTAQEEIENSKRVESLGFRKWLLSEEYQSDKYGQSLTQRSQLQWLCDDNGQLITQFVGRVESIQDDIRQVERGINARIHLVHVNKSRHRDYRDEYCDETRDFVAHHFREDIETFDYTF